MNDDNERGIGASDYVEEARHMGEATIMALCRQVWGRVDIGHFTPALQALQKASIPVAHGTYIGRRVFTVPGAMRIPPVGAFGRKIAPPVANAVELSHVEPEAPAEQPIKAEPKIEYLDTHAGWASKATPCDLVPRWAGEFPTFDSWVWFASKVLTGVRGQTCGNQVGAICVDRFGRRCSIGGDFMRARDEDAFPVRYFWECEPANHGQAASEKE